MYTAEIIAIGSELLTPDKQDTNSLWLTGLLNSYGIHVTQKHVVGDNKDQLADLFRTAMERSDFVFSSGGLGPTFDDITREAFAEAAGLELEYHDSIFQLIRKMLRKRDVEPTKNNMRQGMVPAGAEYVLNPVGTAPGIIHRSSNCTVALLPGPPREFQGVMERMKKKLFGRIDLKPVHGRIFKMIAVPESHAEEKLHDISLPDYADWSILASLGQVEAHIRVTTDDEKKAQAVFDSFESELARRVGQRYFGKDADTIESVVGKLLKEKSVTLAVAESCTGGWLGQRITEVSGSSGYFNGGVLTYSNEAKMKLLAVSEDDLVAHGAVSRQVALRMASGVCGLLDADIGVSITGVAGPTGGTEAKPVGTVYIGISSRDGRSLCHRFHFMGGRESVRFQATQSALDMIRVFFSGEEYSTAYVAKE